MAHISKIDQLIEEAYNGNPDAIKNWRRERLDKNKEGRERQLRGITKTKIRYAVLQMATRDQRNKDFEKAWRKYEKGEQYLKNMKHLIENYGIPHLRSHLIIFDSFKSGYNG